MPKKLLFVTLAGHGHVTPTLALVEELVRRGHHVEYATGEEHSEAVVKAGARWVPLPSMKAFPVAEKVDRDAILSWFRFFFAAMCDVYPVLHQHCATERPDAICYDATNWPARVVAEKLGIPAVRTVPNLASNGTFSLRSAMMDGIPEDHPALVALAEDAARFAAEHGVPFGTADMMDVPEKLNLVFLPREFQIAGDSFDERFRFVGPMLGDRERQEPWTPRDPERPVLFVSLGSVFTDRAFYRSCLEAFDDGAWQVAMNVSGVDVAELGPVPSTVDVRSWFPQPAVLRHAAAFVSHTGMNSTMEALYYKVPLIAHPQMPEQALNADRVQELGLGERLGGAITAEVLRETVDRVASSAAVRANLDRMREVIEKSGGPARSADEIEDYLAASA
ncbi:macrolide family glycosyltransferase [Streptoalloteichus hindustanus]|uniref:Glycosyltransferase, MGT family n=1 Tax=Streptoalloteichus hindustanus TaxID=2017 RepID=A0A1M5MVY4_STRHI|nr:macrolide family glycosyltransferase [Streptoalloteichus hindustanus]SHG81441.1 glycosyltransferase, MGT family [Streptoalloteichus hindustanus]